METETFGRYKVERELGHGGMATVYLGFDPVIKRQVAVKVLPRQFTFDPQFRIRFNREAQLVAALEHFAIVPVYDFGEHEAQPYIIMRYMPGGSLGDRLEDAPLSFAQTVNIVDRLSSALDRAHAQGVVHRDLKPANILFDSDGQAYLSDFGIAKLAETTANLTGSALVGTPAYMSPEQAQGAKDLDGRTDVYSLGLIVFELLSGKRPYEADTPVQLALMQITEPIPNILDFRPELPAETRLVVEQVLAKERSDRFPTPGDFSRALANLEVRVAAGRTEATVYTKLGRAELPQVPVADEALQPGADEDGKPSFDKAGTAAGPSPPKGAIGRPRTPFGWVVTVGGLAFVVATLGLASRYNWLRTPLATDGAPSVASTEATVAESVASTDTSGAPTADAGLTRPPTAVPPALPSQTPVTTFETNWRELEVRSGAVGEITELAWSRSGDGFGSVSDRQVTFWKADSAEPAVQFQLPEGTRRVLWTPEMDMFVVARGSRELSAHSAVNGQQLYALDTSYIDLGWSWDGSRLAVTTGTHVVVFNGKTGVEQLRVPTTAQWLDWSPDGSRLITTLAFTVTLWDAESGAALDRGRGQCYRLLVVSRDGRNFACGGARITYPEGYDSGLLLSANTVQVWTIEPLEIARTLEGHNEPVAEVSWSPDSHWLATSGEDGTIRVWGAATGELSLILEEQLGSPGWAPDGQLLASVDIFGVLGVWEVESGEQLLAIEGAVGPVSWSPDGMRIAWMGRDGVIHIWGGG